MLLIYKIGTHIPVPGINREYLESFEQSGGVLSFMNTISGGALATFSIFAVGIMPYITASIIIQLLQHDIVPKLTEWSKQGEDGKKKTKRLTKILAVIFAVLQSTAMTLSFGKLYPGLISDTGFLNYTVIIASLTIGTILLMIMGDLIEKKGIGSGMSVIIVAGILSSIPNAAATLYASEFVGEEELLIPIIKTVLLLISLIAILVGMIYINQAIRKIPIKYPTQGFGNMTGEARDSYMPIKLNVAGVIPVIFSVAIIMVPTTVAQFFPSNNTSVWIMNNLDYTKPLGATLYAALIIMFSYFYAFLQVNPEKTANDLRESGGFIPGYKPGYPTEQYLSGTLKRLTFVSSICLAIIALLPFAFGGLVGLPQQVQIGGTSLLIVIGVVIDIWERIQTELKQKQYRGFL